MEFSFVEVEWIDIVSDGSWSKVDDLPKPHVCLSRGWKVQHTPDHIVLVSTIGHHQDPTVPLEFNQSIAIPHGVIRRTTEIEGPTHGD